MKIVIATGIYPPDIGGPASLSAALFRVWRDLGHDVRVIAYGAPSDEEHVVRVSKRASLPRRYLKYAFSVWKSCKGADIVFMQGAVSEGLPATIAAMLRGVPCVMRIPGDYAWEVYRQDPNAHELLDEFIDSKHMGKIGLLESIERWSAKRTRAIITPSEYLKRIVEVWGVDESRVHVLLNTVSPFTDVSSEDLTELYGLRDKKVFLCVARAVPWKRVDFLIDVFADLPDDYLLVFAGDGPMLETWKRSAEKKGLSQRALFLGRVDRARIANWYETADAFLLPSGYEGYPFVVAEAVSFGLPCLVSDKAGNPETQKQYPDHVTVLPYGDTDAWRNALKKHFVRLPNVRNKPFHALANEILHLLKTYARTDD